MLLRIAALSTLACAPVFADTVTYKVIADEEARIAPLSSHPSLSDGRAAFLGRDLVSGTEGVFVHSLLAGGLPTVIAKRGVSAPNKPAAAIMAFTDPVFFDGRVVFGGSGADGAPLGIYAGAGAALATLANGGRVVLPAAAVRADPSGVVSANIFTPAGGAAGAFITTNQALPGGGKLAEARAIEPAIGRSIITFAAPVTDNGAQRAGLYAYKIGSGVLSVIANWLTPIPDGGHLLSFRAVDTDGVRVSTIARGGSGRDSFEGVWTFSAGGGDPLLITRVGKPAIADMVFTEFFNTAIDGDTVYFDANIGVGETKKYALFAERAGQRTTLLVSDMLVDGHRIVSAGFSPSGVQGKAIAVDARYQRGGARTAGVALILIQLADTTTPTQAPICHADFDGNGRLGQQDLFAFLEAYFGGQPAADMDASGSVKSSDLYLFLDAYFRGC
jgi:hypothetical protein